MKKLSKILIPVLLLAMLFTLVTVVASAEGEEAQIGEQKYATLAEAVAAAQPGDTVTLLKDVSLTATSGQIQVDKQLTVDLAGHKLSYTDGSSAGSDYGTSAFHAVTGADLTVTSSGAVAPVAIEYNDGLFTVPAGSEGVKVTLSNLNIDYDSNTSNAGMIYLEAPCELTMNHVTAVHRHINNWGAAILVASTSDTGTYKWNITNSTLNGGKKCIVVSKNVGINAVFTNSRITADSLAIGRKSTDSTKADYKKWQGQAIALDLSPVNTAGTTFVFEGCYISSGYRTITFNDIDPNNVKLTFRNTEYKAGPTLTGDIATDEKIDQNSLLFRGNPTMSFEGNGNKIWLLASDKFTYAGSSAAKAPVFIDEGTVCNKNSIVCAYATITYADGCSIYANTNADTKDMYPHVVAGTKIPGVLVDEDFQTIEMIQSGGSLSQRPSCVFGGGIKQGTISTAKNVDGNWYYKYATDGIQHSTDGKWDAYGGVVLNKPLAGISYMVTDCDLMFEDNIFSTYLRYDIRDSKTAQYQNNDHAMKIDPTGEGTAEISFTGGDGVKRTYAMKANEWVHITVGYRIDQTDLTKSAVVYFVNGQFLGFSGAKNSVIKDARAYRFDQFRWATPGSAQAPGKSLCLDNFRAITYASNSENLNTTLFRTDGKNTLVGYIDAVWSEEYQLPSGKIYASVTSGENSSYYSSFDAALAAAKDGDTLTLYTNVTGQYPVTKAITIVKNGYSASTANFYSSATEDTATIYNINDTTESIVFTKVNDIYSDAAIVTWYYNGVDFEEEYYGIGNTPVYKGANLALAKLVDGKAYVFAGWADAEGKAPDKIPADMAGQVYEFSPVYTEVETPIYAVKEGEAYVTFGSTAEELVADLGTMKSGQVMQLLADITVDTVIYVTGNKEITLDMNGHSWTTIGTKKNNFNVESGAILRVMNGVLFNVATVPGTDSDGSKKVEGGCSFYMANATVYLTNVRTYSAILADLRYGSALYIKGGEFYRCVPDYSALIVCRSGNCVVEAENAKLAGGINGGSTPIIDCRDNTSGRYTLTFTGCFIGGAGNWEGDLFAEVHDADITFTGCNISGKINGTGTPENYTITVGANTACSHPIGNLTVTVAEGCKKVSLNLTGRKMTYRYCVYGTAIVDGVYTPDYTVSEHESELTILYGYVPADAETATVIFKNGDEVLATEEYYVGGYVVYTGAIPAGTPTNGFFSYTFAGFDGVTEIPAAGEYIKQAQFALTADVQGMKYNLSLYSNFVVNLYVPKDDRIVALRNTAEGENLLGEIVTIGGKQYYAVRVGADVNKVSTAVTLYVTVSDGEREATQEVNLKITSYAEAVLTSETLTNADKTLMMAMLSYAQQATKLISGTEDAAIAAILAKEAYAAYIPAPKTVSGTVQDVSGLAAYIESAQLNLDEQPDFRFNIKSGVTCTVTASYVNAAGETITATAADGVLSVNTMRLYEFANDITITVKDGDTVVATGTYNLATYLAGAGVDANFSAAIATYVEICKAYKA